MGARAVLFGMATLAFAINHLALRRTAAASDLPGSTTHEDAVIAPFLIIAPLALQRTVAVLALPESTIRAVAALTVPTIRPPGELRAAVATAPPVSLIPEAARPNAAPYSFGGSISIVAN